MAVRTSWSAGQVLTAADLTDTFAAKADYPAGGSDGQALLKSGTSTAWGNVRGLVFITSQTFTSSSAVNLNSVFTSTYANYRVLVSLSMSAGSNIAFRFRASGSDDTTANYDNSGRFTGTSVGDINNLGATAWNINIANLANKIWSVDILGPELAAPTTFLGNVYETSLAGAHYSLFWNGAHRASTSFDGFHFSPGSGTITGRVSVFGYRLT